jgi:hypothetical protein
MFADALIKMATQLRGALNIEQVIDPIDLHISSAIMTYQEMSTDVMNKVCTLDRPPAHARAGCVHMRPPADRALLASSPRHR